MLRASDQVIRSSMGGAISRRSPAVRHHRITVRLASDSLSALRRIPQRMEKEAPGVSGSLLEGLDEMLTVNRLRLPPELRRSLACANAIEKPQGTIRRVTRNVKRWRDASMALRWAAAGMLEAKAGFRRLKAYRHLPALRRALAEHTSHRLDRSGLLPNRASATDV